MKTRRIILFLVFFVSVMTVSLAYADKCPYCGKEYGEPAPGDEARVYALRQEHKSTCPSRPDNNISGLVTPGYDAGVTLEQAKEERLRQQEELRIEEEKIHREHVKEIRHAKKDAALLKEKLNADRKEIVSTLKGGAITPGFKDTAVINPLDLKENTQGKGLNIKEVPSPVKPDKRRLPLFAKKTGDIILDALEEGNHNLDKSIAFLERNLKKYPDTYGIKEALSCLEGMRAGAAYEKKTGHKFPFEAEDSDSSALIEVVAERAKPEWPWQSWSWPWSKDKEHYIKAEDSSNWKIKRTELFLEALEKGNKDLDKSIEYLEQKKKGNDWETARQSLEYLYGFFLYKECLDKQKN